MSTFSRKQQALLKRAQMTSHERFLADEKRKKTEKQFQATLEKRQKRHDIRMAKIGAHLKSKKYEGPEFSSSIPNQDTTVATLVTRGGFQSPVSSPPTTPKKSGKLVHPETPVGKKKLIKPEPLSFQYKPRKRPVLTRAERKRRLAAKGTKAKAKRTEIDISDTTHAEEKEIESGRETGDSATEGTASESETGSESDFFGYRGTSGDETAEEIYYAKMARNRKRLAALRKKPKGVSAVRGDTNVPAFRAARAKEKRARQAFAGTRVAKRHKITTHHPFVPKLQIRQKGPGQFSVRSNGISDVVTKHVQSLLSRIKGKLFINGKFTAPKRAFSVIMALLRQKQVIEIVLK